MPRKQIIWITGVTGFTGRHLVRYLQTLPESGKLIGLSRSGKGIEGLHAHYRADLTAPETLIGLAALHPPDIIYHLAGQIPPAPDVEFWHTNVAGTLHLLQALHPGRKHRPRILIVSSAAVYLPAKVNVKESHPAGGTSSYGRSKWAQEAVALSIGQTMGLDIMIARTFNLIGPGLPESMVAGKLCAQFRAAARKAVRLGSTSSVRDFVDVRDAVAAYRTIAIQGKASETYNVCTSKGTPISALVDHFQNAAKTSRKVISAPGSADCMVGNNDRLKKLGWSPGIFLRQSVTDMLKGTSLK